MTAPERDTLALGLLLLAVCLLALLAGCGASCLIPSSTRCSWDAVQVCAGGRWRTVRECSDVGPQTFECVETPGEVAACMPRGEP